jgi:hypothetical protein
MKIDGECDWGYNKGQSLFRPSEGAGAMRSNTCHSESTKGYAFAT